jgi:hypothetical protein
MVPQIKVSLKILSLYASTAPVKHIVTTPWRLTELINLSVK